MNRTTLLLAGLWAFFPLVASRAQTAGPVEQPLVVVTNPPPVQMLVPGFSVRELPLALNNINNLVYAPDGRLFALGYDGDVFQLKDTDGDGLEDTATCFFKNENNAIPPSIGMAWGPGGLYIASQRRVIRMRDKGDGTSELETVASGWVPPTGAAGSGLDSVGIAVDREGNIFFGLGCDDWQHAYRVNKETGKSEYNILSDRGTIQRVSADWKKREAICTGLRFTVSLAFNAAGDLFCTDQEGASWLPNGNPFDELLLIQPGRHYGFPPRHPKYLPTVIDEPSVFDYAPQHQSTCGLHFNEPAMNGGATFGPAWWRGNAIVSGESRGKIWRTQLVKTAAGYVAQTELIACLNMLTVDAVPTPQGDLVVTCHSGKPDWGTGPPGKGKLFKISYTDKTAPQPVLAYAASPTETRITFDRPVDAAQFKNLTKKSSVTMGRYVGAGDRFESFRPGYQAVNDQTIVARFGLAVLSTAVSGDARTLVLQTPRRTEAVNYAVTLPCSAGTGDPQGQSMAATEIDLLTDLTGVEATWRNSAGETKWSGWLPHLDLVAARGLTAASTEHTRLFELATHRGTLTLQAQLDPALMLHPKTQPGAKLDYEYPPEAVTFVLKATGTLEIKTGTQAKVKRINAREWRITTESKQDEWLPIEIKLGTGTGEPKLDVSWFTAEDSRTRALPLRRILLPWATPHAETATSEPRRIPEIAGGDWQRGKQVFFGEQAACFKCHQVGGEGGKIGPDLSNLIYRDYVSVLRDIMEPSAALNP
ncbi:MAG: hypothetical protein JWR69_1169, partial [Pedosphaera sp.]|nr:hypothetical protein [Pedosphaera sp.]